MGYIHQAKAAVNPFADGTPIVPGPAWNHRPSEFKAWGKCTFCGTQGGGNLRLDFAKNTLQKLEHAWQVGSRLHLLQRSTCPFQPESALGLIDHPPQHQWLSAACHWRGVRVFNTLISAGTRRENDPSLWPFMGAAVMFGACEGAANSIFCCKGDTWFEVFVRVRFPVPCSFPACETVLTVVATMLQVGALQALILQIGHSGIPRCPG
jgi:hypothetical protein